MGGYCVNAYIVSVDEDIDHVFVDRKKARTFWVFDIWCYGVLSPGWQELRQSLESFRLAERHGEASMYGDPKLTVKEVTA